MSDKLKQTIRIQRGEKVGTDDRGHSVWTKPVDTIELELVSTVMLQTILDSDDEKQKQDIRELADQGDGVIARTPGTGAFDIVTDEELAAALEAGDQAPIFPKSADVVLEPVGSTADVEVLSLVSTQALKRMLHHEDDEPASEPGDIDLEGDQGGYNPYDSG